MQAQEPMTAQSLAASDFELLGLEERFDLDAAALEAAWKRLQRQAHPDQFAAEGAAAQRVSMQRSVRINEAHQRLRDPLRRAAYLCERRGVPVAADDNTAMPPDFLMQQMEWREALDEARSAQDFERLLQEAKAQRQQRLAVIAQCLDGPTSPDLTSTQQAAQSLRALMFVERFRRDVADRLDRLEHPDGG